VSVNNEIKGGFLMKKMVRFLAVFVFVISISIFPFDTASAQPQQLQLYVSLFGGYTFSPDAEWEDEDYDFDSDLDIQETGVFGVKFGYTPLALRFLSFEVEYSYLNPDIDRSELVTSGSDYIDIEGDVKLHNFMFNVIAKYPEGRLHPYVGGGVGASYVDVSATVNSNLDAGEYDYSADNWVFSWQILAGVEIDLAKNFSLDIGYRYFATETDLDEYDHDYDDDDHDDDNDKIFDFNTSMVTLGFKLRF
jgi:opacity protein-like surface antigen